MLNHKFRINLKSKNSKTGNLITITSDKTTCSDSCIFKNNGCYAGYGPMNLHWNRLSNSGLNFGEFIASLEKTSPTRNIRFWDAGDFPRIKQRECDILDKEKCLKIADTLKDRKSKRYGYTHYDMKDRRNRSIIRQLLRRNLIINISITINKADEIIKYNLPVILVTPTPINKTPGGTPVVMCPHQMAQLNGDKNPIQCDSCMKCNSWPRNYAIGFLPHGGGKKKVLQAIEKEKINV